MKFVVKQTLGSEVIADGPPRQSEPIYYGGPPPETGRWHVDLTVFEAFCADRLAKVDFGMSIETYYFGLEIAELQAWGAIFTATSEYTSYRPKMKSLVSVGQIEWSEIKHDTLEKQLAALWAALLSSIDRVASMQRKPKDFDSAAFAAAVRVLMTSSDAAAFAIVDASRAT